MLRDELLDSMADALIEQLPSMTLGSERLAQIADAIRDRGALLVLQELLARSPRVVDEYGYTEIVDLPGWKLSPTAVVTLDGH
jgi:hypothetical protein